MAEAPSFPRSAPLAAPVREPGAGGPPPRGGHTAPRGLLRRVSVWLPATAVVACAGAALGFYHVPVADLALFSLYVVLGIALPGLLLVRVLYRRAHTLPEEIALGLTLGYALEVLTYIPARALGAPLFVLAWPVCTYVAFLAVPRLRRYWKGGVRAKRTPLWWSWCSAASVIYLIGWSAVTFFRSEPLTWPALGKSFVDMPFHLALVGELKNHMPPTMPAVAGEPLVYHWFVYAHLAAASWVTGVEPLVLVFRLAMLPMLAAFVVLLGTVGRRITGSRAGALAGVAGTLLITAPSLYVGQAAGVLNWKALQSWASPTQTFGALFFAPIVLLLIDLLEGKRPSRRLWALLAILLVAVMGAKATYLPLLTAGLVAVALVQAAWHFCLPRRALAALGLTGACLLFAQFVLFGGVRQGLLVDPLMLIRVTLRDMTSLDLDTAAQPVSVLGVTMLCVLSGAITWSGVLGLLGRPRLLVRPVVTLVLGMAVAGLGMALLFGHPHLSQIYFLQAPSPYVAMVAVCGLLHIVRRARLSPRAVVFAAAAGMLAVYLIRAILDVEVPLTAGQGDSVLFLPYLALLGVVVLAVLVLRATQRSRLRTFALVICLVTAAGTPAAWFTRLLPDPQSSPTAAVQEAASTKPVIPKPVIPEGEFAAGRWLRAHSAPDDVIATNVHCRWGYETPCDSREFWATALSERRVLVEGWGYTAANMDRWQPGQAVENLPFWDRDRIEANDVVFRAPSPAVVRRLRADYGVRWLLVDEREVTPGSNLGAFAKLRFDSGDYAVFELPGSGGSAVERR
ncbi:hypothetical protein ABT294_25130 [Nonomuraea sp. NPDC000554]|uniref:hypothetical protein n=1 Tax=Nonomuraea sp. NPDC000554 TaxID=3154259 RepID=UPI00331B7EFE